MYHLCYVGLTSGYCLQYDVQLVQDIEELLGKKLEEYELDEDKVLKSITKVCLLSEVDNWS